MSENNVFGVGFMWDVCVNLCYTWKEPEFSCVHIHISKNVGMLQLIYKE